MLLHVLLVSVRQESIGAFAKGLSSDPEVCIDQVTSGADVLNALRTKCPHLIIIDSGLPDTDALDLVRQVISFNAMVNTAVVSSLSDDDFHDKGEGLGILSRLPFDLGPGEADGLLKKLRSVLS
ncbi:MAG: hypothetical protein WAN11_03180 [Syntrophobacteraceae bacterium]